MHCDICGQSLDTQNYLRLGNSNVCDSYDCLTPAVERRASMGDYKNYCLVHKEDFYNFLGLDDAIFNPDYSDIRIEDLTTNPLRRNTAFEAFTQLYSNDFIDYYLISHRPAKILPFKKKGNPYV